MILLRKGTLIDGHSQNLVSAMLTNTSSCVQYNQWFRVIFLEGIERCTPDQNANAMPPFPCSCPSERCMRTCKLILEAQTFTMYGSVNFGISNTSAGLLLFLPGHKSFPQHYLSLLFNVYHPKHLSVYRKHLHNVRSISPYPSFSSNATTRSCRTRAVNSRPSSVERLPTTPLPPLCQLRFKSSGYGYIGVEQG